MSSSCRNTHPTKRYVRYDIMIFHWRQCKWQTHFALLREMSLLSLASFCQIRAEMSLMEPNPIYEHTCRDLLPLIPPHTHTNTNTTRGNLSCWQIKVICFTFWYENLTMFPTSNSKLETTNPIAHSLSYNILNFWRKWSSNKWDTAQRSLPCRFMFGKKVTSHWHNTQIW